MSSGVYNTFKDLQGVNWSAGADSDYKVMLVTSSYTPDPDHLHPNASGLAANEITGGSYARQNVGTRTKAVDNATDAGTHSAANPTFTALVAAQPRYAIVYQVVTGDTDHILVCWIDIGASLNITGDMMVKYNSGASSGILFQLS